jgi:hypothetical protein
MSGQLSDWFWLDRFWSEFAVVLELELDEDEELPLAAFAIAAPPPAITPSAATVTSPRRNLFMIVHLPSSRRWTGTSEPATAKSGLTAR